MSTHFFGRIGRGKLGDLMSTRDRVWDMARSIHELATDFGPEAGPGYNSD